MRPMSKAEIMFKIASIEEEIERLKGELAKLRAQLGPEKNSTVILKGQIDLDIHLDKEIDPDIDPEDEEDLEDDLGLGC